MALIKVEFYYFIPYKKLVYIEKVTCGNNWGAGATNSRPVSVVVLPA
jgi:hypothetical protein